MSGESHSYQFQNWRSVSKSIGCGRICNLADLAKEGPSGTAATVGPISGMMPVNEAAVVAETPKMAPVEIRGLNNGCVHPMPLPRVAHVCCANPERTCGTVDPLGQLLRERNARKHDIALNHVL